VHLALLVGLGEELHVVPDEDQRLLLLRLAVLEAILQPPAVDDHVLKQFVAQLAALRQAVHLAAQKLQDIERIPRLGLPVFGDKVEGSLVLGLEGGLIECVLVLIHKDWVALIGDVAPFRVLALSEFCRQLGSGDSL
jgi:hypothetical protein